MAVGGKDGRAANSRRGGREGQAGGQQPARRAGRMGGAANRRRGGGPAPVVRLPAATAWRPQVRPPGRSGRQTPPEMPHRAGAVVDRVHDLPERLQELGRILAAQGERREQLEHVHVIAGRLGEDAMVLEEGTDDHLGEKPAAGHGQRAPPGTQPPRPGTAELDADQQPAAADLADQLVAIGGRLEALYQLGTHPGGVVDQALVVDHREGGQAGGHGQGIGAEGGVVDQHAVHGRVHPLEYQRRPQGGADRDEPPGQGLGDRHQVGLHPVVLVAEHPAGPPQPGLHLVADQQGPIAVEEGGRRGQEPIRHHLHTLALDRFED